MATNRPSPKTKAKLRGAPVSGEPSYTVRRKGEKQPPFQELNRREGAKRLGSSRVGEVREAENRATKRVGMGDVRREERKQEHLEEGRINRIAHRMVYGRKKET